MFNLLVVFAVLTGLFTLRYYSVRYWYMGYGVVLVFCEEDGSVWIASRLIGSPAHQHGIRNFSRLVSIDGEGIKFGSIAEYHLWVKKSKPYKGMPMARWVTEFDGYQIAANMTPALITSRIPMYWDPGMGKSPFLDCNSERPSKKRYCSKTGEYYTSEVLSTDVVLC